MGVMVPGLINYGWQLQSTRHVQHYTVTVDQTCSTLHSYSRPDMLTLHSYSRPDMFNTTQLQSTKHVQHYSSIFPILCIHVSSKYCIKKNFCQKESRYFAYRLMK